jgi:serine phosphatase RsbU (regulator of sigma subunit)
MTITRAHTARPDPRARPWTHALQRQLIPGLPWLAQPPGWTPLEACGVLVTVRYHSADPRLRIGGDWYLSMPLAGGDLLLAVGDVAGHGLTAAAEMVRLRCAMASLAAACDGPAEILDRLNMALCRRGGRTATAVAARFRRRSGELTWAQAGHPPILAAGPCGVRRLPNPEGMMLGVDPGARFAHATARLDPGDFVVMYTDGVFRRSDSIDQGIDGLTALAAAARRAPAGLLDHVNYNAADDDACVLVAERVR